MRDEPTDPPLLRGDHPVEWVEWVDRADQVIAVVPRSRMRAENLLHRSVAIIVTTSDGRLVVQRRADSKDVYPGWWDIGAGGVLRAGEPPVEAARRELFEELGVDGDPEFVAIEHHEDVRARESCRVYRVVHDGPFRSVDGEAAEIRVVDPIGFAALIDREPVLPGSLAMLLPHLADFRPGADHTADGAGDAAEGVRCVAVQRVEFTIEPFVEARPGEHVTAPVEALVALGIEVEMGPFASGCEVATEQVGEVVALIVREAIAHGATHINLDVNAVEPGGTGT